MANFGPLSRGPPHSPDVNHCVLHFRPGGHREPRNEVGSLSPVEHLVGIEPGTFRFSLQRLNPLGHLWPDPMKTKDLATFIEEIRNRKLHFFCCYLTQFILELLNSLLQLGYKLKSVCPHTHPSVCSIFLVKLLEHMPSYHIQWLPTTMGVF